MTKIYLVYMQSENSQKQAFVDKVFTNSKLAKNYVSYMNMYHIGNYTWFYVTKEITKIDIKKYPF